MKIHISEIMKQKNITRYALAKQIGITYKTMASIYKGEVNSIRLDILEDICLALDCTPNDIFIFENKCSENYDNK